MARFLFGLWDGGGNVPPALAIASRLVLRSHAVQVLGDPTIESDARSAGASFVAFREAPHRTTRTAESEIIADWAACTPLGAFARARDRHAFGPANLFAREVRAADASFGADAVVVDAMLFGGLVGAEATGRPWAAVIPMTSFLPAHGRPPAALGLLPARGALGRARDAVLEAIGDRLLWRSCLPLLNRARTEQGLAPVGHPLDQIRRAGRVLVLTSPSFDWGAPVEEGNVVYTGPELGDPAWASDECAEPPGEGPLIVVALSSTYQGQEAVLGRILEALSTLPVRALVTLGPGVEALSVPVPPNAMVVGRASHGALLRRARLVITHGGHGTVLRALAAGVPLVVLPMGRDQADNAARVAARGAGIALSRNAPSRALRSAVARAIADTALRAGARALAATLLAERRGDRAVDELEGLAARSG
jgi:MGT family glycosyltransferase